MKSKKIITIALSFMLLLPLASCGKKDNPEQTITVPTTLENVLGHGYDITGRYAYSPEIKEPILDLEKLINKKQVKRDLNLSSGTFESIEGADISNYQKSLSTKISASVEGGIKKIGSFKAEIQQNFDGEITETDEYAFATSSSNVIKDAYYIAGRTPENHFSYLSSQFVEDIKTLEPSDIVYKYGTHVMLGGVLGARLDYHMSAQKKVGASSVKIGAYAKAKAEASLKGIFSGGASGSADIDSMYASSFETSSVTIKTKVYGGRPEYAQAVQNERDYQAWIESIEGREVWCDYYPNSLINISSYVNENFGDNWAEKKAALETYIDNYLEGNTFIITNKTVNGKVNSNDVTIQLSVGNTVFYNSRGDLEMDTQSGSTTVWEIWVNNQILNDRTIRTTFKYKVWESKGDWTTIELSRTIDWSVPKKIKEILTDNLHITGQISGKNNSLETIGDRSNLKNIRIQVDGQGEEDQKNIKAIFNFSLDYKYFAFVD